MTALSATHRSRTVVYFICWLSLIADGYDLYVYGTTLPAIIGQAPFNVTAAQAGTVGSLALIGMLIGSLVVGILTDKLGRRRILIGSVLLFSTFMLVCAFAPTWELFAAARFVACFGVGGLLPTAVALASEFALPERKSLTLGIVLTGPALGTVAASLSSMLLIENYSFRPVYALGCFGFIAAAMAWKFLPESPAFLAATGRAAQAREISQAYGLGLPSAAQHAPGNLAQASPTRQLLGTGLRGRTLRIWLVTLLSMLTMFGVSTWLPQIMRNAGYGLGSSVSFLLAYSLGAMLGTVIASMISQRIGVKPLVVFGFSTAAAALLMMTFNPGTALMMMLVALTGFGGMGTQNQINDYIAQFYPGGIRATGLGWALAIGRLGAIAGPTYGAVIIATGTGVAGASIAFAVPAIFGAAIMLTLPRVAPAMPIPGSQPEKSATLPTSK